MTAHEEKFSERIPARGIGLGVNNLAKIAALAAIPVLVGGWIAFRPEKLFVNQTVKEKLPTAAKTLGKGSFASYAHETTGQAALVAVGGTEYVRLSDFKTSNGPDVHLYLVKGSDPQATAKGFLDLGTLKGNVGDQNYAVPAGTDLAAYGSVAVWCKRFNVGFGGAEIMPERKTASDPYAHLAAFGDIVVTHGRLKGISAEASIVETGGKRFLQVTNAPKAKGLRVLLVKAETIKGDATVRTSPKIDLGVLRSGTRRFPLSKAIDAWLYRSVSLWNGKKSVATADLRSDQERVSEISPLWI